VLISARFSSEQLRDFGYCEETTSSLTQNSVETSSLPGQDLSQSNDNFECAVHKEMMDASSSNVFRLWSSGF
jgi:hypothetical protein